MAIKIYEQFAPFANPADGDYPYGSIKNDSIPGAEDGTPLDAVWANDYAGSDAELFAQAGIVPNGVPDKLGASQRVEAIKQLKIIADGSTTPRRLGERFADVVNVKDFGAIGDGFTDDTEAFRAAALVSKNTKTRMQAFDGAFLITDPVYMYESLDMRGGTLVLNSASQNGKKLFNFVSRNEFTTVTGYDRSELSVGQISVPSLENYKDHFITIESNERHMIRHDGANQQNIYKRDCTVVHRNAVLGSPLIVDFTNTEATLTVQARAIDKTELVVENMNISWDFKDVTLRCTPIAISRCRTTLRNITQWVNNDIDSDDTVAASATLGSIEKCSEITLSNINMENVRDGKSGYSYVFYGFMIHGWKMYDCTMMNGWHSVGTNIIKEWVVRDSTVCGLDVHYNAGNVTCDNVKFIGEWGFNLGNGYGDMIMRGCTNIFAEEPRPFSPVNAVLFLGGAYALSYKGRISVKDHTVLNTNYGYAIARYIFDGKAHAINEPVVLPDIVVDNLRLVPPKDQYIQRFSVLLVEGSTSGIVGTDGQQIHLPEIIDVSGVTIRDEYNGTTTDFYVLRNDTGGAWTGKFMVNIDNVHIGIPKGYLDGVSGRTFKSVANITLPAYAEGVFEPELHISNCTGVVRVTAPLKKLNIRDSVVQLGWTITDVGTLYIHDSELYSGGYTGATRLYLSNSVMRNNIIYPYLDSSITYGPVNFVSTDLTAKVWTGNVFDNAYGNAATTAQAAKMLSFIGSGYTQSV